MSRPPHLSIAESTRIPYPPVSQRTADASAHAKIGSARWAQFRSGGIPLFILRNCVCALGPSACPRFRSHPEVAHRKRQGYQSYRRHFRPSAGFRVLYSPTCQKVRNTRKHRRIHFQRDGPPNAKDRDVPLPVFSSARDREIRKSRQMHAGHHKGLKEIWPLRLTHRRLSRPETRTPNCATPANGSRYCIRRGEICKPTCL